MKETIKRVPILGPVVKWGYYTLIRLIGEFPGSVEYWKQRYRAGRTSGAGSYNHLAEFKAEVLNNFVRDENIKSVIEFGCGDGNQLRLAEYPSYIGFDISPEAISECRRIFSDDDTKRFKVLSDYDNETAELTLSLDVIYHLLEDDVFHAYMERLFNSATRYVIIYSSNTDVQATVQAPYVKHRKFSKWIEENKPEWQLKHYIRNRYAHSVDGRRGSFADFFIYEKAQEPAEGPTIPETSSDRLMPAL